MLASKSARRSIQSRFLFVLGVNCDFLLKFYQSFDRDIADHNEEIQQLDFYKRLNLAFKLMEIIGEIVKNYSGTYDGKYHGIGVTVKKPASGYEIYYSKTSMSSGNYETAGSKQPLSYDSVSVNNGVRTYYTVYYYIHSTDRNFKDFGSFGTVRIDPVYLDITSGTAAYSKIYDGDADVKGSVTVSGDGKYILAHKPNLYIITGFVSGTGDSSSSLLDF